MSVDTRIGVVGAGAWGTALALASARAGRDVLLWTHDPAHAAAMDQARENRRHLPGAALPASIAITAEIGDMRGLSVLLLVTPAQSVPQTADRLRGVVVPGTRLVLCAKGIERATGRFLSDRVAELVPEVVVGALSGPSFAADVGRGLPTAVTLALPDEAGGMALAAALASPAFRPYWTADLRGVEIGGALKNVFAIAAGIVAGRGLGESARAAIIARAFAELVRFGVAHGARAETFSGLSGLGDLVLTATSEQSRNLRFGLALGRGEPVAAARAALGTVEGAQTAVAAAQIAAHMGIDMPLTQEIARVVEGEDSIDTAIERLMRRPLRPEG